MLCALFFEGSIVLAMLLAFADLVSWWGVLATPAVVAAMVKLNDVVAGRLPDPHAARRPRARSEASGYEGSSSEALRGRRGAAGELGSGGARPAAEFGGPEFAAGVSDVVVSGIVRVGPEDSDTTVPLPPLPAGDPEADPEGR
ncbi:hypothetical protein [Cryptosporangium japonicum]|uniref:hypothetical protein n=1 Tax=Cryptosporangium japonicum TaxID=80872 RepID=UPI0031DCD8D0